MRFRHRHLVGSRGARYMVPYKRAERVSEDLRVGTRHLLRVVLERVSTYEVEPRKFKGYEIPGHVVWRYEFKAVGLPNRKFVYSGKYIFGINPKSDIWKEFSIRATIKRHEPRWGTIRLCRIALQKEAENLFA